LRSLAWRAVASAAARRPPRGRARGGRRKGGAQLDGDEGRGHQLDGDEGAASQLDGHAGDYGDVLADDGLADVRHVDPEAGNVTPQARDE